MGSPPESEQTNVENKNVQEVSNSSANLKPRKGVIWPQVRAILAADLAAISIGMIFGFTGVVLPELRNDPNLRASEEEGSWVASSAALSAPVGCLLGMVATDNLGRRRTLMLSAIPSLIGWIMVAAAHDLPTMYVGRVFSGISIGCGAGATQIYLSEAAETHLKGVSGSTSSLSVALGTFLVYVLGVWLPWRAAAGACALVPAMLLAASICTIPETPSWLASRGRREEAELALRRLRGKHHDVRKELAVILGASAGADSRRSSRAGALRRIRSPAVWRPFGILFALFFSQQFSGAFVVIFYAVDVFRTAAEGMDESILTLLTGGIRLVLTVVTTLVIKKVGVRPLTIWSAVVMSVSLACLGAYIHLDEAQDGHLPAKWLPAAAILVFMSAFTPGVGTVPWFLIGELFPLDVRGVMGGATTTLAYSLIFSSVKTFPYLIHAMGKAPVFWLYSSVAMFGAIFSFFFLPETRGKSLRDIEDCFASKRASVQMDQGVADILLETNGTQNGVSLVAIKL